jgi:hypothetical protein
MSDQPQKHPDDWFATAKVELDEAVLPKLRATPRQLASTQAAGKAVPAILRVAQSGYVPPGVEPRAWIEPTLYTANVSPAALEQLAHDPGIIACELSQPLQQTD